MNKLILRAFTLVAVLVLSIGACVYVVMDAQQYYFKALASDEVDAKKNLETIKVSLKDYGGNIGDEIWANGNMYDVSSYVVINDTAIVTVYHDNREEDLVRTIADDLGSRDNYMPGTDHHVSKYKTHLTDDGKILCEEYSLKISTAPVPVHSFCEQAVYPTEQAISVTTPPPDGSC